jgi:class 3 adenylate cyclase
MLSTLELETCTHWTLATKQYPPLLLQAKLEHQRFCVLTASKCIQVESCRKHRSPTRHGYTRALLSSFLYLVCSSSVFTIGRCDVVRIELSPERIDRTRLLRIFSLIPSEISYVAIAELFPEATVMFANIAGFTAWSSLREPAQVFMLLESIFQSFDEAAQKLKIFKVETVGDCYLAVCGVPQYNKDHAIIMARFARACQHRSQQVFHSLGNTLGPDTVELGMRFGVHSGPVTAGVLRGDRARFQLFGDTVNTASRIESAGEINQIHISEQTASLLRFAGKFSWIRLREDRVEAKGKEFLETFWLKTKSCSYAPPETALSSTRNEEDHLSIENTARSIRSTPSTVSTDYISMEMGSRLRDKSTQRLVDWNCELLQQFLRQVVARRHAVGTRRTSAATLDLMAKKAGNESNAVHQVADIITMPNFDERAFRLSNEPLELEPVVVEQLRNFVDVVCSMYHDNPFHNFEHASHVAMSVTKLLSRIVAPTFSGANIRNSTILGIISSDGSVIGSDELEATQGQDRSKPDHARTANTQQLFQDQAQLHDHTYGITSDPLTQFAVVLSALVHDVDHRGVPNFLLVKENEALASVYHNKSVAEQNSIDLAWNTLLAPEFDALRACIYSDLSELRRFRQTLVNSVIATDIFDKDLSTARKARWIKAFHTLRSDGSQTNEEKQEKLSDEDPSRERNRKATIVIEHLIQASDVAHTMQHWHVYQKWNAKLFEEMYNAFLLGRSDQDPSLNWYNGEIGFFDNYIIPLAKNLKDCGVFGVSSDEYLNYALQNRREWELKGRELVSSLVDRCANNR